MTTNRTGRGEDYEGGSISNEEKEAALNPLVSIATCAGCQVNWNAGVDPNAAGQVYNMPPGYPQVEIQLDTGETYLNDMPSTGAFNIPMNPPPANRPAVGLLYLVRWSGGLPVRKLVTNQLPVVG